MKIKVDEQLDELWDARWIDGYLKERMWEGKLEGAGLFFFSCNRYGQITLFLIG